MFTYGGDLSRGTSFKGADYKGFCFTEYGEKENDDLRARFNINKDDFPVYKLFKQNDATPVDFKGEVKADELAQFVKTNSRLWIGMCSSLSVTQTTCACFLKHGATI